MLLLATLHKPTTRNILLELLLMQDLLLKLCTSTETHRSASRSPLSTERQFTSHLGLEICPGYVFKHSKFLSDWPEKEGEIYDPDRQS
jgi:hypothetical protein